MKAETGVEVVLERLGREWPADGSIVERVLGDIEATPLPLQRLRGNWRLARWLLATAASLAVAAAAWSALRTDNSLYAQVLKAVHRARTFQMITSVVPSEGGKPAEQTTASFFERGVGFRAEQPGEVCIGRGTDLWRYIKDAKLVVRTHSDGIDKIVDDMLDRELGQALKHTELIRYEAGDETIDGRICHAHLLVVANSTLVTNDRRMIALLDERSRIVRIVTEVRAGDGWKPQFINDWKYDVPLDRTLFEPNFGDDVKIVDGDAVFDEFVSVENSLHHEERSGLIYAIHHVEQFENGGILLLSSVRGTAETLETFPLSEPRPLGTGFYFVDGPAVHYQASPQGSGYFAIELAVADHQGIDVRWWVLVPRGKPPTFFDVGGGKLRIPVGITPNGDFAKANFADEHGVIHHLTWDIELLRPHPKTLPRPTLDALARQVYAEVAALEVVQYRRLNMGPKDNVQRFSDPSKTTAPEFAQAASNHIRYWKQMDVEFQLEGQFTAESQQEAATWGADQAIGLMYESLVDDATLVRVAKHAALKRLYLEGTRITDAGLEHLAGLGQLKELSLADTSITDAGLTHLTGMKSLRKLNVEDTQVTPDGIARLKAAIPALNIKH